MLGVLLAFTGLVLTMKLAVVELAATVTLAGTVATEVLLLDSVTTVSPDGAGASSVTVPVDELPPFTEVGLRDTEMNPGAVTVSFAVRVLLP